MINSIKLIGQSFYSIFSVRNYIEKGKGTGTAYLGVLSLLITVATIAALAFSLRIIFNTEEFRKTSYEIADRLPEIVIKDGELQMENDDILVYTYNDFVTGDEQLLDEEQNINVLVINPTVSMPSMVEIQDTVMYLSKTTLYVNNGQEIKDVKLADLQKASGKEVLNITSDENIDLLISIIQKGFSIILVFALVFGFFIEWLINVVLAKITRFFAKHTNKKFQEMSPEEIRRAAAIGITPPLVVIIAIQFFLPISGMIKWLAVIIIGVILMSKYKGISTEQK